MAAAYESTPALYFYTYDVTKNENKHFNFYSSKRIVFFEPKEVYHKEFQLEEDTELTFDSFTGFLMQNLG